MFRSLCRDLRKHKPGKLYPRAISGCKTRINRSIWQLPRVINCPSSWSQSRKAGGRGSIMWPYIALDIYPPPFRLPPLISALEKFVTSFARNLQGSCTAVRCVRGMLGMWSRAFQVCDVFLIFFSRSPQLFLFGETGEGRGSFMGRAPYCALLIRFTTHLRPVSVKFVVERIWWCVEGMVDIPD